MKTLLILSIFAVIFSASAATFSVPDDDMIGALRALWENYRNFVFALTIGCFGIGLTVGGVLAALIGCCCSCRNRKSRGATQYDLDGYSAVASH